MEDSTAEKSYRQRPDQVEEEEKSDALQEDKKNVKREGDDEEEEEYSEDEFEEEILSEDDLSSCKHFCKRAYVKFCDIIRSTYERKKPPNSSLF